MKFAALAALAVLIASPAFAAQKWIVDQSVSKIEFSGKYAGKDFKGRFDKWTADITFDPADLKTSSALVTIDTGSAATGDKTYDGSLPGADWFNVKNFPQAVFKSKEFHKIGDGYEIDGILTIRDVTQSLAIPFTLTMTGDTAHVVAKTPLDRLGFGLGKGSDPGAEWVGREVMLNLDLTATKAAP